MDSRTIVQSHPVLSQVRALLSSGHLDKALIYECRIAVALAFYSHLTSAGARAMEAYSGLCRNTLTAYLPAEGQTSPHGLIRCVTRGRWSGPQERRWAGDYRLAGDHPDRTRADYRELEFLDPASDNWTDPWAWAIAVLYGEGDHVLTTTELLAVLGNRSRLHRVSRWLQAKGFAVKVARGSLHLLFTLATPSEDGREHFNARRQAHHRERMQWLARVKDFTRQQWRKTMELGAGGRLAMMHYLGFTDATIEDTMDIPDHLVLTEEEESWVAASHRRRQNLELASV